MEVVYLCDGKACELDCVCVECKHTSDITHAVNFEHLGEGKYFEKERSDEDDVLIIQCYENLRLEDLKTLYSRLVEMKRSGVVLIPSYCKVVNKNEKESE